MAIFEFLKNESIFYNILLHSYYFLTDIELIITDTV